MSDSSDASNYSGVPNDEIDALLEEGMPKKHKKRSRSKAGEVSNVAMSLMIPTLLT